MSTVVSLYLLFCKIAVFTFGGGYAMIPLFQSELVDRTQMLTPEGFANMVALAQMTPGPVGLNAATYIGCQQCGVWGAVAGTLGVLTPSLILMTLVAIFLTAFKKSRFVQSILSGIRPATIGLVASAVIFFANISVFTAPVQDLWLKSGASGFGLDWRGCLIFLLTLLVRIRWKINLFIVLSGSVVLSILLHLI